MSEIASIPPPGERTPEQIRSDIVRRRTELGDNVDALRARVRELTDIRRQVDEHRTELMIGAAAVGVVAAAAVALKFSGEDGD